jgi:hypothetical protein
MSGTTPHPRAAFILDIVDKAIKAIAVMIAGVWTWWNYRKSRTYQQKLELEITGAVFTRGNLYGDIKASVRNIGAGKHIVQNAGTFCIVSIVREDLSEQDIRLFRVFSSQTQIEPGESMNDTQYWHISAPFDDILWVKLTLRVVSGGVEWITTCLVRVENENEHRKG